MRYESKSARVTARLALCLALAAMLMGLLAGCAAYNYPKYADKQSEVYKKQAVARAAAAQALGEAVKSDDARTRDSASMALLVMVLTDKPLQIEAPREGLVERGLGAALSGLPYIGLAHVIGTAMDGHGGNQVNVEGSQGVGVGTGGGTGTGSTAVVQEAPSEE